MQKAVESVRGVFKPRLTPQQQVREWQRRVRQEARNIERQIRDIQREETAVRKSIKDAAKRNDLTSAKVRPPAAVRLSAPAPAGLVPDDQRFRQLAAGHGAALGALWPSPGTLLCRLGEDLARRVPSLVNCLHAAGTTFAAWLTPTHLALCAAATVRAVGHLQKSAEVMKLVNGLVKAPEVSAQMQELSQELMKAGVMEEMVSESIDSALDTDEIEEETEEEVDKVLSEIAGETAAQLPSAARREREQQLPAKQQQVVEKQAEELLAEAGGGDNGGDAAELEALRARFNSVRT
eukprot:SM000040S14796  [mRNA]  locus=s40:323042:324923:- [translate_table: standard]